MRFLYRNIGARIPKELTTDHWAFRIQKLAFYEGLVHWGDIDRTVLGKMTALQVVYLVVELFVVDPLLSCKTIPYLAPDYKHDFIEITPAVLPTLDLRLPLRFTSG